MRTIRIPETPEEIEAMAYEDLLQAMRDLTRLLDPEGVPAIRRTVARTLHARSVGHRGAASVPAVIRDLGVDEHGKPWISPTRFHDVMKHRSGGEYRDPTLLRSA